jgi:hypothetical protein
MPAVGLLRRLLTPYLVARNALDYPLRRSIRFRRPVDDVEPAGIEAALADLAPSDANRARTLVASYGLDPLAARGRRRDVRENLYYLELLLGALDRSAPDLPDPLEVIDVGVSDWFYAPALVGALRHWRATTPRRLTVLGFEADPGSRYVDGRTREDWAAWYTRDLPEVDYRTDDARAFTGEADLAAMLFPFVFPNDSDDWGLPRHLFRPRDLLAHVWSRVRPGGLLIVASQGEAERDRQRRLFAELGIAAETVPFESPFWTYDLPRFVHTARRSSSPSSSSIPSPGRSDST